MRAYSLIKKLLLILTLIFSTQVFSQLSKTHFIPPLTSSSFGNANPEGQYIYISTPNNSPIPYTIIPVGQPAVSYITGNVSNITPQVHFVGTGNGQLFVSSDLTSLITNNKGYIIEAEAPIYVSVRMNAGSAAQAGALVSKGLSALDTNFRIGTFTSTNPGDNYLSFVSVMATEDNTVVTFNNIPVGLNIKNYTGPIPISVTLNRGESYVVAANMLENASLTDGLIGCLVTSDNPIVVNCGSSNGSFHNGSGRDYGIDQIAGLSKVGNEYIFVRGDGNNNWENILVVAHTDNTTISINGNTPVTTINAGEYYVIEGNNYNSNGNMYVETSTDVFMYQGLGSTSEANQGLFFVPPLSCETRGNIDNIANINSIGSTNYNGGVSIVTKTGATVSVNNLPLSSFSTVGPSVVTGNTEYVTYKITGLTGNVSIQGNDELYVAYFNVNGSATSGGFYSGFPTAPEINFDAQFATLGNCIPNITLEAANAESFDNYEWFYDDGSGFQLLASNTPSITPTIPAKYKLIGEIICTGETLESVEVPVSICPDDSDNDGIIDNIDIDNDNDGILNCTESIGDVVINIQNINSPQLIFQDNSTNSIITSANYTETSSSLSTNTFSGDNTGNFTSTVSPANNANGDYTLSFTESVNIKFSENTNIIHTSTDGEFFIAKISPSNKNITLVDPDNRLLIDSNFDGIFETGITQMSSSEIHFKINPSPSGNIPYQFLANQIDGFSFIHNLTNITETSTFNGNLSLTCFKLDSDLDGIKDELDLDSDNDGIPDQIENTGTLVALSGVDTDLNGLDDVFDLNATPVDSDNDNIYDFYDLDSDNDGIYDLIEAGLSTLIDSNLDGIEDGPNFGVNGWADVAETSPDSNIIGYTPNDLDSDTILSYLDLDSDGDTCSDVIEAGFSDGNSDDLLGDNTVITDVLGKVTNASDGYTLPNTDYLTVAPISITSQPIDTEVCELSNTTISLISSTYDAIQWEFSTDGINWNAITNNTIYNDSQTADLIISNVPLTYNTYQYRAFLNLSGNSCGFYSDAIELTVNPLPVLNSPVVLVQCDDDDAATLGFSPFNLTEANDEISTNSANETFSYFLTQAAAISGDTTSPDYISNETAFVNRFISSDAVWARVESTLGCIQTTEIQLNVSTTVIPSTFLVTFNQCDDFLDIDGNDNANNDDRDGIATFDFSSVTATILSLIPSGQTPLPPRYYRNETDALAEINEIVDITNYRNIGYPGSQDIYVRVDSDIANDCLALGAHVLLNVETLPVANPVNVERQCDFDTSDTDITYPFDTTNLETDILNGQSLADVSVTYFDELGAALTDFNGTLITSPFPNTFLSSTQTITARVTNNVSTAPDGPCFDEITIDFTVDEQPTITNTILPQIVCDGDIDDIDNDGFYPFDTSTFSNTILGAQTNMEIYYDYIDENGVQVTDSATLPNPFISSNQTINIEVINPVNLNCIATSSIDLIVNPVPEFTVDSPHIVCTSDPTFLVELDPIESSITEIFTYEWLWTSSDNSIVNQFISSNSIITVSDPGTYSVTLTKTDGTGCSKTMDIIVNASEIATITQDDVTINDLSENNSVIIDPTNLGSGNYEYALQEEGTPFITYQDEPVFNNVRAGFYTIYVRDEFCGESTLDISVIGHPKYFTPNNDGFNDYWQIRGLSETNQPNSVVQIFDRYGKLLKQLPIESEGWDGTFNGALLQTDDYWFKLYLEDGREYSGHFTLKR